MTDYFATEANKALADKMSKMKRRHSGKLIKPTRAEAINARLGNIEQKRDSMAALISRGEPTSGIAAQLGKIRRMQRRRRR